MQKDKFKLILDASMLLDQAENLLQAAAEADNGAIDSPALRELAHQIRRHNVEIERRIAAHFRGLQA